MSILSGIESLGARLYNLGGVGNPSAPQMSTSSPSSKNTKPAANAPKPTPNNNSATGQSGSTSGGSAYAGSSSSRTSNADPVAASYYGSVVDQLKAMLGSLGTQQDKGVGSINNNSNLSLDRANKAEGEALSQVGQQRQVANTNKVRSLSDIDSNVVNTVNSFKRLAAAGHAGDSAFTRDFVPLATSREGSKERQGVFNGYGQDMGKLDTTEHSVKEQHDQSVEDITNKRNQDIMDFINGISGQRDSLNQQASQAAYYQQQALGGDGASTAAAIAPFSSDTNSRIAALNALFSKYANPTYNVNPVQVTMPDLSDYTQDPLVASLSAANPDTPISQLPFLPIIKKQQTPATV